MTENTAQSFGSGSFHGEVNRSSAPRDVAGGGQPRVKSHDAGKASFATPQHAKVPRLSRTKKSLIGLIGLAQLGLATAAGIDLARRDPKRIHGPKAFWYAVLPLNWIGPIAYFMAGRKLGRK
ncbi:PLD nuclease N-terminal domain-containing protein [Pseudoclavibacter albus]|uniref:PLD nuclease N-terminal domain-containing protein n=1 Tax=Pseudoclavibacter albus TaxID=272241 RepID=UPI000AA055B5|nr:PLD nuclease N-terminal domain-containing protein [Pseudoclavibacter alba]